ncbi:MAG: mobilization protein [Gemmatimonas sp.]|nr:mobilization protein [Gemmatimonas sp.]MCA2996700.1 mobilization protein [Gemmatimonas sp.]
MTQNEYRQRAEQMLARAQAAIARAKKRERADDTARRILLGAWLLRHLGNNIAVWPEDHRRKLDAFLVRDRDRLLFGLSPRSDTQTEEP